MKYLYVKLMLILFVCSGILNNVLAQVPEGIVYQAEARDDRGRLLADKKLEVFIYIIQENPESEPAYGESHSLVTNSYGMFTLLIGDGEIVEGDFSTIEWSKYSHYLNVQVKKGKKEAVDMGTTQFLSVPYALHSKTASTVLADETDPVYAASEATNITATDIANLSNLSGTNTGDQELSISNNEITISGGNTIMLPPDNVDDADADASNELNANVTLNGNVLEVTDAGGTKSADLSSLVAGGDLTSCDILLNFLILTGDDVANLINAGAPIIDLFNAGYGVGTLEQNGVSEQDLTNADLIGTVDDADGNTYKWVKIGDQVWMAENLAYNVPGSWAYDDDENNVAIYGRLYNWEAALTACPAGWHVPSDAEWIQLSDYLIANGFGYGGSGNEIAKSLAATTNWSASSVAGTPGNDLLSNNSCGFSGLSGGYRDYTGSFDSIGSYGFWRSSTESLISGVYFRYLVYTYTTLRRSDDRHAKNSGFSVRCVRD